MTPIDWTLGAVAVILMITKAICAAREDGRQ